MGVLEDEGEKFYSRLRVRFKDDQDVSQGWGSEECQMVSSESDEPCEDTG